jgi:hypothetical protein
VCCWEGRRSPAAPTACVLTSGQLTRSREAQQGVGLQQDRAAHAAVGRAREGDQGVFQGTAENEGAGSDRGRGELRKLTAEQQAADGGLEVQEARLCSRLFSPIEAARLMHSCAEGMPWPVVLLRKRQREEQWRKSDLEEGAPTAARQQPALGTHRGRGPRRRPAMPRSSSELQQPSRARKTHRGVAQGSEREERSDQPARKKIEKGGE